MFNTTTNDLVLSAEKLLREKSSVECLSTLDVFFFYSFPVDQYTIRAHLCFVEATIHSLSLFSPEVDLSSSISSITEHLSTTLSLIQHNPIFSKFLLPLSFTTINIVSSFFQPSFLSVFSPLLSSISSHLDRFLDQNLHLFNSEFPRDLGITPFSIQEMNILNYCLVRLCHFQYLINSNNNTNLIPIEPLFEKSFTKLLTNHEILPQNYEVQILISDCNVIKNLVLKEVKSDKSKTPKQQVLPINFENELIKIRKLNLPIFDLEVKLFDLFHSIDTDLSIKFKNLTSSNEYKNFVTSNFGQNISTIRKLSDLVSSNILELNLTAIQLKNIGLIGSFAILSSSPTISLKFLATFSVSILSKYLSFTNVEAKFLEDLTSVSLLIYLNNLNSFQISFVLKWFRSTVTTILNLNNSIYLELLFTLFFNFLFLHSNLLLFTSNVDQRLLVDVCLEFHQLLENCLVKFEFIPQFYSLVSLLLRVDVSRNFSCSKSLIMSRLSGDLSTDWSKISTLNSILFDLKDYSSVIGANVFKNDLVFFENFKSGLSSFTRYYLSHPVQKLPPKFQFALEDVCNYFKWVDSNPNSRLFEIESIELPVQLQSPVKNNSKRPSTAGKSSKKNVTELKPIPTSATPKSPFLSEISNFLLPSFVEIGFSTMSLNYGDFAKKQEFALMICKGICTIINLQKSFVFLEFISKFSETCDYLFSILNFHTSVEEVPNISTEFSIPNFDCNDSTIKSFLSGIKLLVLNIAEIFQSQQNGKDTRKSSNLSELLSFWINVLINCYSKNPKYFTIELLSLINFISNNSDLFPLNSYFKTFSLLTPLIPLIDSSFSFTDVPHLLKIISEYFDLFESNYFNLTNPNLNDLRSVCITPKPAGNIENNILLAIYCLKFFPAHPQFLVKIFTSLARIFVSSKLLIVNNPIQSVSEFFTSKNSTHQLFSVLDTFSVSFISLVFCFELINLDNSSLSITSNQSDSILNWFKSLIDFDLEMISSLNFSLSFSSFNTVSDPKSIFPFYFSKFNSFNPVTFHPSFALISCTFINLSKVPLRIKEHLIVLSFNFLGKIFNTFQHPCDFSSFITSFSNSSFSSSLNFPSLDLSFFSLFSDNIALKESHFFYFETHLFVLVCYLKDFYNNCFKLELNATKNSYCLSVGGFDEKLLLNTEIVCKLINYGLNFCTKISKIDNKSRHFSIIFDLIYLFQDLSIPFIDSRLPITFLFSFAQTHIQILNEIFAHLASVTNKNSNYLTDFVNFIKPQKALQLFSLHFLVANHFINQNDCQAAISIIDDVIQVCPTSISSEIERQRSIIVRLVKTGIAATHTEQSVSIDLNRLNSANQELVSRRLSTFHIPPENDLIPKLKAMQKRINKVVKSPEMSSTFDLLRPLLSYAHFLFDNELYEPAANILTSCLNSFKIYSPLNLLISELECQFEITIMTSILAFGRSKDIGKLLVSAVGNISGILETFATSAAQINDGKSEIDSEMIISLPVFPLELLDLNFSIFIPKSTDFHSNFLEYCLHQRSFVDVYNLLKYLEILIEFLIHFEIFGALPIVVKFMEILAEFYHLTYYLNVVQVLKPICSFKLDQSSSVFELPKSVMTFIFNCKRDRLLFKTLSTTSDSLIGNHASNITRHRHVLARISSFVISSLSSLTAEVKGLLVVALEEAKYQAELFKDNSLLELVSDYLSKISANYLHSYPFIWLKDSRSNILVKNLDPFSALSNEIAGILVGSFPIDTLSITLKNFSEIFHLFLKELNPFSDTIIISKFLNSLNVFFSNIPLMSLFDSYSIISKFQHLILSNSEKLYNLLSATISIYSDNQTINSSLFGINHDNSLLNELNISLFYLTILFFISHEHSRFKLILTQSQTLGNTSLAVTSFVLDKIEEPKFGLLGLVKFLTSNFASLECLKFSDLLYVFSLISIDFNPSEFFLNYYFSIDESNIWTNYFSLISEGFETVEVFQDLFSVENSSEIFARFDCFVDAHSVLSLLNQQQNSILFLDFNSQISVLNISLFIPVQGRPASKNQKSKKGAQQVVAEGFTFKSAKFIVNYSNLMALRSEIENFEKSDDLSAKVKSFFFSIRNTFELLLTGPSLTILSNNLYFIPFETIFEGKILSVKKNLSEIISLDNL
ncbi:hypothetical protein RCL1_005179 [Eukaryota sp. TZLM3-RCL]